MKDANYIIFDGDAAHSVGEFVAGKDDVKTQLEARAKLLGIATPRFMTVAQYEKSAGHKAIVSEGLAAGIRAARNARMVASDWTQLPDITNRFPPPNRDAWASYRKQVMRVARTALDSGAPLDAIKWPTEPE